METIYNGTDNLISFKLLNDGEEISDYSGITKVVIKSNNVTVDSDVNTGLIDWSNGRIDFKAGLAGFPAGKHNAVVTVYDSSNTNGVVWSNALNFIIRG
jgi:hypothetical protein